mmetsp:Transcript_7061/g.10156  ORF Transcript_7061/g.10156 Transcript_7061/m.10156 type:complete len:85 (+) Transcript_7061:869-1123(+)
MIEYWFHPRPNASNSSSYSLKLKMIHAYLFTFAAGEGLWTMDTSNPLLQDLATAMGSDLTAETCAERYAETWEESHSSSIEVEE